MGRESTLEGSKETALLDALRAGATKREAAESAGVGIWVVEHRARNDEAFSSRVDAAIAEATEDRRQAAVADLERRQADAAALQAHVDGALAGLATYADASEASGYSSRETVRGRVRRGEAIAAETAAGPLVLTDRRWVEVDVQALGVGAAIAEFLCVCGARLVLDEGAPETCACGVRWRVRSVVERLVEPG